MYIMNIIMNLVDWPSQLALPFLVAGWGSFTLTYEMVPLPAFPVFYFSRSAYACKKRSLLQRSAVIARSASRERNVKAGQRRRGTSTFSGLALDSKASGLDRITLTTSKPDIYHTILEELECKESPKPTETLGTGSLAYVGTVFSGGFFAGQRQFVKDSRIMTNYVLSFSGDSCLSYLEKARESERCREYMLKCNVTTAAFYLPLKPAEGVNTVEMLINEVTDLVKKQGASGVPLFLMGRGLAVGKPTMSKFIEIEAVNPDFEGVFTNMILRIALSGGKAKRLLATFFLNSEEELKTCFALSVFRRLKKVKQTTWLQTLTNSLANEYPITNLRVDYLLSSEIPPALKPVLAACSLLFKRLTSAEFGKTTSRLIVQNLMLRIFYYGDMKTTTKEKFLSDIIHALSLGKDPYQNIDENFEEVPYSEVNVTLFNNRKKKEDTPPPPELQQVVSVTRRRAKSQAKGKLISKSVSPLTVSQSNTSNTEEEE
jgi:hypothetical protein